MASCRYLLSALLVAIVCATVSAQTSNEWEAFKTVSRSNLDFSNALYKVLSRKEGNLLFSPTSIHTILALTSLGARGPTSEEMVQGLRLPADKQKIKDGFRFISSGITPNVTLKVANKIFTDARYPLTLDFALIARDDFYSVSELVDFFNAPEEARATVNSWTEGATEGKIVNLLPAGSVGIDTAMVLVNAVYFKGTWKTMFSESKTNTKPFYVSNDVTKDVPMMHLKVKQTFGYLDSEILNAQILEIPYTGNMMSLVIILPKERNGLSDVEARLSQIEFSNISSSIQLSRPEVHLSLPKFKLEESLDMQETLEQMGMRQLFQRGADFSGLAAGPIQVSKVVHKTFMEVNEEGTVAAAATGVVAITRSQPRQLPQVTFNVNHPFIFILAKTETGGTDVYSKERTILFMGRYVHP